MDDQVRVIFDHLLNLPSRPVEKLDIFLVSNGGNGVIPWRLVSLFREFAKGFSVIIPYRAYSAATLLALGADEIVMHPFGELGPIDPTVSNAFNPKNQFGQPIGISVEDVKAYISFIKKTGITHEDELVKTMEILATQVHPLALGNVERFVSQSRMMATKILRTHMDEKSGHMIDEIVENMTSKLFFHGHPINRKEAKDDLGLKVKMDLPPEVETAIWNLYLDYEKEFKNSETYDPAAELLSGVPASAPPGLVAPAWTLISAIEPEITMAIIESRSLTSTAVARRRLQLFATQQGAQVQEQGLAQRWEHLRDASTA
jgi:hypothetical protein